MKLRGRIPRKKTSHVTDAKLLFSNVITDILNDKGFDRNRFTDGEIVDLVRTCTREAFYDTYYEFILWVAFGDDIREMTKAMLRLQVGGESIWDVLDEP